MTRPQLPGFGNETLIPFLCQFNLDGFYLFIYLFYLLWFVLIMPASAFVLIFTLFSLLFSLLLFILFTCMTRNSLIYCIYSTLLLFCEHDLHDTSYFGVWFPPDRRSRLNRERGFLSLRFFVRMKKFLHAR